MDVLTGAAAFNVQDSLLADAAKEQLCQPMKSYPAVTAHELAVLAKGGV